MNKMPVAKATSMILILLLMFILLQLNIVYAQDYQLVWSDEFEGSELDLLKWEYMTGDGTAYGLPSGWGNNELQWYRPDNVTVENGHLVITAKKETYSGKNYTSARIRTINKGDWKYGRFEFRIKFPFGKGIWSAIWMMPTDNVYGGWAASGEIDIIEHLGHESNKVYGTLHYGGPWPQNTQSGMSNTLQEGTFADDFHLFALEWEEGIFKWFVDDSLYQTQTSWYSTNGEFPAPFDQRFHLLINVAVGGNWPGNPDATTTFPQMLEIDYVRVYQQSDTSTAISRGNIWPVGYALGQNYPNPFNPSTTIKFTLSKSSRIALKVYNLAGQEIETLVEGFRHTGEHELKWVVEGLPSGIYFYRLQAAEFSETKKLILQK
ncbi:MAG: family 16 glycosylhydrolase [Bacteroidales bacterium]|nr:family 16 glycosylhydrolase [Bacteroidales bacterium]